MFFSVLLSRSLHGGTVFPNRPGAGAAALRHGRRQRGHLRAPGGPVRPGLAEPTGRQSVRIEVRDV